MRGVEAHIVRLNLTNTICHARKFDPTFQETYWSKSVVTDLSIPLAVYLGFKNIYLLGCDATNEGHCYQTEMDKHTSHDYIIKKPYWAAIKEVCEEKGVKIYNCSEFSKIDIFPKIRYTEVLGV